MLILDWTDETKHPDLKQTDRLMGVLYHAGIADLETLAILTGWKKETVRWAIHRIRKKKAQKVGDDPDRRKKERDQWIRHQRKEERGPYYYSLGMKGFTYIVELLGEKVGKRRPPEAQVEHFKGINDVLVRLLERNVRPVWYSTREATSWIHQGLKERTIHYNAADDQYQVYTSRSPWNVNPDAMVQLPDGRAFFIEYETGSNHGAKLQDKFFQYVDLQLQKNLKIDPILWVTPSHNVAKLKKAWEKVQETMWEEGYPEDFPYAPMVICEEGEETDWLLKPKGTEEKRAGPVSEPDDPSTEKDQSEVVEQKQKIEQLERELAAQKERLDFWAKENEGLQRYAKEQEEWIRAVDQWLSERMLIGKGYQSFLEKHPIPKKE